MTRPPDDGLANKGLVRQHIDLSRTEADFDGVGGVWAAGAVVDLFHGTAGERSVTIRGMDVHRMADGMIVEWIALGESSSATRTASHQEPTEELSE